MAFKSIRVAAYNRKRRAGVFQITQTPVLDKPKGIWTDRGLACPHCLSIASNPTGFAKGFEVVYGGYVEDTFVLGPQRLLYTKSMCPNEHFFYDPRPEYVN